ncbi:MAG: alkaline phosphatase D family protein [Cellulophaga sp.]|uniref:alkaline phosphatase D family protein n=1 Tax=unclassified Cellulophaga TaxID=2634405 RepID=UPI000C2BA719|nr:MULTISPECIES: alkaline phosphatase D family protein [unclassified Cellulophaga]MDO6492012.1 alkaline phosphatase D family protein [Cellulophaga sp. 2_MG-2023]MDO6495828.1 alkaline phosphatase D family protein [Cellulophaga sp. 3_MG-2023]PKB43721.1 alkaline phosphatase D [Cellulophaga sp. RHA19]
MKKTIFVLGLLVAFASCKTVKTIEPAVALNTKTDFTIAFGSCNKHDEVNPLWDDILSTNPNLWIWGGDIIYADTDNIEKIRAIYAAQDNVPGYKQLKEKVPVIGTWDDHDYGLNDGGAEFKAKKESEQEFLDFMDVAKDSPRRTREGVYAVHNYNLPEGKIKVLVLDTRYFRTALTPSTSKKRRVQPNVYGEGTILGEEQWKWLTNELVNSDADFNVLISSVQYLSNKHGFEGWGNFPHEVDRLKKLLVESKAKGTIILSGDRHISEFSVDTVKDLNYPLVDFTSSGLTHTYTGFNGEENPYRVGEVVFVKSFGLLNFDFKTKTVDFKMMGDNGQVLGELKQTY